MPYGFISIGSNINKEKNIKACLQVLRECFGDITVSSIYESESVGFIGDSFYNAVVGFHSDWGVLQVAAKLKQIEIDHGRTQCCTKFSARTLDLDLILYGDLVMNEGGLSIPRDDIEKYAFVLQPLADLAPTLKHPVSHIAYAELWENYDKSQVRQKIVPFTGL